MDVIRDEHCHMLSDRPGLGASVAYLPKTEARDYVLPCRAKYRRQ